MCIHTRWQIAKEFQLLYPQSTFILMLQLIADATVRKYYITFFCDTYFK